VKSPGADRILVRVSVTIRLVHIRDFRTINDSIRSEKTVDTESNPKLDS
jgi:hypothetical protein